jgi:hypothetical protein
MAYRIQSNPRAMQGGAEDGHDLVERQNLLRTSTHRGLMLHWVTMLNIGHEYCGHNGARDTATMGWGDTKQ